MLTIESLLPIPLEKMTQLVDDALIRADDGELFLEHKMSESVVLNDSMIKNAASDVSQGFGLRALQGEATFYAHSADLSLDQFQRAVHSLTAMQGSGTQQILLSSQSPVTAPHVIPVQTFPFEGKVKLLQQIDAFARGLDARVMQVAISLGEGLQNILIMRRGGQIARDQRVGSVLTVRVTVEHKGRREHGAVRMGGSHDLTLFFEPATWQAYVREALRKALLALEAVPIRPGVMPVILGHGGPGVLLHEAVGHGLEGDFNRKGQSIFSTQMGQKVAAPGVTVIDDGSWKSGMSSLHGALNMDDEGTPTQETVLIEDGVMVGHMCDRLNGRLLGKTSTGNGRRQSYAHMPMPRMTNTYMKAGTATLADMLTAMKNGIYAVDFDGGQVDIVSGNFVFGASEAYLVEDGKITTPIKEATLIGNGPEVMKKITHIGSDLEMDEGFGYCGKNGQTVIVGLGQPSLLISELTVGGAG